MRWRDLVAIAALALGLAPGVHADPALLALLQRGGQVVLMRHAQTDPGVGDPEGMVLVDCATQRNLSEAGRAQAAAAGASWRSRPLKCWWSPRKAAAGSRSPGRLPAPAR